MTIDATFWVAISFFIFLGILVYLKVPQKINNSLTDKINEMKKELELENDLVVLSRFVEGGGDERIQLRALGSKYFNLFSRTLLRIPIKDLTNSVFLMKLPSKTL